MEILKNVSLKVVQKELIINICWICPSNHGLDSMKWSKNWAKTLRVSLAYGSLFCFTTSWKHMAIDDCREMGWMDVHPQSCDDNSTSSICMFFYPYFSQIQSVTLVTSSSFLVTIIPDIEAGSCFLVIRQC